MAVIIFNKPYLFLFCLPLTNAVAVQLIDVQPKTMIGIRIESHETYNISYIWKIDYRYNKSCNECTHIFDRSSLMAYASVIRS